MPTMPVYQPFVLQFADSSRVTAQPIPREDMGREIIGIRQRLLQKALRGFAITRLRKKGLLIEKCN